MTSTSSALSKITTDNEEFHFEYHGKEYRIFRPPGVLNWQMRVTKDGKQNPKSLGTPLRDIAKKQAKTFLDALFSKTWEEEKPKLSLKKRPQSTFGELVDLYKAVAPGEIGIGAKVARANAQRLLQIVTELYPDKDARALRIDALETPGIRRWARERKEAGANEKTLASMVRQARSVLTPKMHHIYAERLNMPRVLPSFTGLALDNSSEAFVPIPEPIVQKMEAAYPQLPPNVRRCYLLMARLGLRNNEAAFCRRSWFERHQGKILLVLKDRPEEDFLLKNSLAGVLEVHPALWEELTHDLPDTATYLLDGETKTERHRIANRSINIFVRQYLPDRQKSAYELRKWAGSIVCTRAKNIYPAQVFLRHKSVKTTEGYYATYLNTIGAVSAGDIASIYAAPAVAPSDISTTPSAHAL